MKRLFKFIVLGMAAFSLGVAGCSTGEKTKIRVATEPTWPPFEAINESTQQFEGFDIDLMNAIAERAGLEVEFVSVAWDPLLEGMGQCAYDAAISTMTILPERQEKMLFSDPYFVAGQVIAVQEGNTALTDYAALADRRLGAQLQTTGAEEADKVSGATVKLYDDINVAFQDLLNGQLDAVIADNPFVAQYMRSNPGKIKVVGTPLTDESYGIAICKKQKGLQEKINKALAEIKADGTYDALILKWGLDTGQ